MCVRLVDNAPGYYTKLQIGNFAGSGYKKLRGFHIDAALKRMTTYSIFDDLMRVVRRVFFPAFSQSKDRFSFLSCVHGKEIRLN